MDQITPCSRAKNAPTAKLRRLRAARRAETVPCLVLVGKTRAGAALRVRPSTVMAHASPAQRASIRTLLAIVRASCVTPGSQPEQAKRLCKVHCWLLPRSKAVVRATTAIMEVPRQSRRTDCKKCEAGQHQDSTGQTLQEVSSGWHTGDDKGLSTVEVANLENIMSAVATARTVEKESTKTNTAKTIRTALSGSILTAPTATARTAKQASTKTKLGRTTARSALKANPCPQPEQPPVRAALPVSMMTELTVRTVSQANTRTLLGLRCASCALQGSFNQEKAS